ncbi:MAG: hypothetical protein R3F54_31025 [Alphaproteobacteria bacterium]
MNKRLLRYLLILLLWHSCWAARFLHQRSSTLSRFRLPGRRPTWQIQVFGLGTVEAACCRRSGSRSAPLVSCMHSHGDLVQDGDLLARLHAAEQKPGSRRPGGPRHRRGEAADRRAPWARRAPCLAQREQSNRRKQALVAQRTVSEEIAEEAQMEEDDARRARSGGEQARGRQSRSRRCRRRSMPGQVLLDHHELQAPYDAIVVARHRNSGPC